MKIKKDFTAEAQRGNAEARRDFSTLCEALRKLRASAVKIITTNFKKFSTQPRNPALAK
jgi:hypothetical protein